MSRLPRVRALLASAVLPRLAAPHARPLVATVTDDEAIAVLERREAAAALRRAEREPRGAGRVLPPTCPACHRWVVNVSTDCGCGWSPTVGWR